MLKGSERRGEASVGFDMAHVRIIQGKCATQQSFHRQHYASLGVKRKREDWSVRLSQPSLAPLY
jgi:hypothetical protein